MSLATDCPHCQKNFVLPDKLFGKRIKCKSCGGVFRVGGESAAPPEAEEFDKFDAVDRTHAELAPMDGDAGTGRKMPGAGGDDFATQYPGMAGSQGDDFATQYPMQGKGTGGDDFATQYPLQGQQAGDDFATQVPPTAQDFSQTQPGAGSSWGDETSTDGNTASGETWSDTKGDADYFGSGDTHHDDRASSDTVHDEVASGDTVADQVPGTGDTAVDFIPGEGEIAAAQQEAQAADGADAEAEDAAKGKLPGKGKLPAKGLKLPAKGGTAFKGKLPAKSEDEPSAKAGTGKLPGKGALPDKGKKLPTKATKPGVVAGAGKKKGSKLPLFFVLFLLLDLAAFAAVVYVPDVREAVGLNGQPWLNDIAQNVGGHVDAPAKPAPTTNPGTTNEPASNEANSQPEPVKPEPVKPEPVKPEPVKPEPVKPEPKEPEPVVPEPKEPEPVVPEPKEPEPVVPEPKEPEPVVPEPKEPEPVVPEPKEPEPVVPEPKEPEPVVPEPKEPEPVVPEPKEPEPVVPEPKVPEPVVPEPKEPEPVVPEPKEPEPVVPEPKQPEPKQPEPVVPVPLPEPVKPKVVVPEKDPFKSDWPKFERKAPKPAEPGRAKDFFNENFDAPRYDWKWLPAGTRAVAGKPGVSGALEMDANKQFDMSGSIKDGEIRMSVWRDMSDSDKRVSGDSAKSYEIRFRAVSANMYHALQIRGDGYYRIIHVSGGKTDVLVGDNKGGYLPIPHWDRNAEYDNITLVFRGKNVAGSFNGTRLASTDAAGEGAGNVGVRTFNGLNMAIETLSVDE